MKTHSPKPTSRSLSRVYRHVCYRAMERYHVLLQPGDIPVLEQAIRRRYGCVFLERPNNKVTDWKLDLSLVLGRSSLPPIKVRYCRARQRIVTVVL